MSYKLLVWCLLIALPLLPTSSNADTIVRTMSGTSSGGNPVALEVTIDFTPTGGDFNAGTGTATASFTLENTSGLQVYSDAIEPAVGNPILTGFMFNVPCDAVITSMDAWVLAGSSIYSTGTNMVGTPYPRGCTTLSTDELYTSWYELEAQEAAGFYGIFTNSLETQEGVKGGIVDPEVLIDCELQGEVFSPIYVVGPVMYVINIECLTTDLDTAADFLTLCSFVPGAQQVSSALAAKFQGADGGGEFSCFVADEGYCGEIGTEEKSWGSIKSMYKD
jgi:hypothetical protein